MIDRRGLIVILFVALIGIAVSQVPTTRVVAQGQWTWPEKAENLKVLPKDMPKQQLRAAMVGFSNALGVRCEHCHVGEAGQPLSTFDFVSDENPMKDVARAMLNLSGTIRQSLTEMELGGSKRVEMTCYTCHRGRPKPLTLVAELTEAYDRDGWDATAALYRDLRGRFYGRGAYDFGEESLNLVGYQVLGNGHPDVALQIFQLNIEFNPESFNAYHGMGEAYVAEGKTEMAIEAFEKSLELEPRNVRAAQMLEELKGE